jgi:hypothetical protein
MLTVNGYFYTNVIGSVEAFLAANVMAPYNAAIIGTTFAANQLTFEMDDPDDYSTVDKVPVILADFPEDIRTPSSTGMGDREVWVYPHFSMKVYPALSTDTSSGAQKPDRDAAVMLRSFFANITTALTIPLYDFTVSNTVPVDFMYIDAARVTGTTGPMKEMLALEKYRFNFDLRLRFAVVTLNG